MLIVNADDYGRSRAETDAVVGCYAARRITSTTAMVFMADSLRAADAAKDCGIDVGLHLNLSERFTAPHIDERLQHMHNRVVSFLTASRYAILIYNPLLRREFSAVIHAQIDEFVRLYGRAPVHVDGHRHHHLCANVLVDKLLPSANPVRRSFSFWPGEKSVLNRLYRRGVDQALARDHRLADYFFSLEQCLQHGRLPRVFALAKSSVVEVMAHPVRAREYDYLMSDAFRSAVAQVSVGTYAGVWQ
jgi:predicted glycoside hydrolase/deacetylase ChbG (UPF0249 family)